MGKYVVKVNQPNLMKGTPVELPPVGVIENGGSLEVELDEETVERLSTAYGVEVVGPTHETITVAPAVKQDDTVVAKSKGEEVTNK